MVVLTPKIKIHTIVSSIGWIRRFHHFNINSMQIIIIGRSGTLRNDISNSVEKWWNRPIEWIHDLWTLSNVFKITTQNLKWLWRKRYQYCGVCECLIVTVCNHSNWLYWGSFALKNMIRISHHPRFLVFTKIILRHIGTRLVHEHGK